MTPNGLNAPVDPDNPASLIRWTASAAAAFDEIKRDVADIKANQAASAEWRVSMESRMGAGAQTFQEHGASIREFRRQWEQMPEMMRRAVEAAMPRQAANPTNDRNGGPMTFKWALEKVALPLLMSGVGAGITLVVARAIGALVVAP